MTFAEMHFMRGDPQLLQRRLAKYVEPMPAKELARQIGSDIRTAENIKGGHWPTARHWLGLIAAFGEDLTEAVFHPERAVARLEKEVRDLEAEIELRRAALRDHQSLGARVAEAVGDRAHAPPIEARSFQEAL